MEHGTPSRGSAAESCAQTFGPGQAKTVVCSAILHAATIYIWDGGEHLASDSTYRGVPCLGGIPALAE